MRLLCGLFVTTVAATLVVVGVLVQLLPLLLLVALVYRVIRRPANTVKAPSPPRYGGEDQHPTRPPLHYVAAAAGPFNGAGWVLVPVWVTVADSRRTAPVIDADVIDVTGGYR